MARIKDQSVRDVVAAADIVEVVSQRTSLRKQGSRYVGRCPFHDERTPSFSVNAADKLYYCFGCSRGGDVVRFVRRPRTSTSWGRSRRWPSASASRSSTRRPRRTRMPHAAPPRPADGTARPGGHLLRARAWETPRGEPVRAYLAGRGLGEAIAREFRLGLSPGRGPRRKGAGEGLPQDELRAAGLVTQRGSDYFPQRLMFPLTDARGRIVGFQARKLRDDDPLRGKYVNSPESDLFKKSHVLYGCTWRVRRSPSRTARSSSRGTPT